MEFTDEMKTAILEDLEHRLRLGPNDEAAIGAFEVLDRINEAASSAPAHT